MKPSAKAMQEEATAAWAKRHERPEAASQALVDLLDRGALTPYQAALAVGARPAEIPGYIDLAALDDSVRKLFIAAHLPASFSSDLLGDPLERQLAVVRETASRADEAPDLVALFYGVLSRHRLSNKVTVDRVTGKHLAHASSKAVQYGVLMPKQRGALVSMGVQMMKRGLNAKQKAYANSLLEKLQDKNVLTASCAKIPCALCDDFRRIVQGG